MSDLKEDAVEYEQVEIDYHDELDILLQAEADFVYWANMPFWTLDEGIALLLGKDPERVNWGVIRHYVNSEFSIDLCFDYSKLRTLILRSLDVGEIEESNSPAVFLTWAESKQVKIPEMLHQQVAHRKDDIKDGTSVIDQFNVVTIKEKEIEGLKEEINLLQKRIVELEGLRWEGFDEEKETYSKELAIAVKAHDAVSKNWKKGSSVKRQIYLWLQANYPKLFNEEKDRISKICNWQKSGGAPCTP